MEKFKRIKAGVYKNSIFEIKFQEARTTSGGIEHGSAWVLWYGVLKLAGLNTLKEAKEYAQELYEKGEIKAYGKTISLKNQ